MVDDVRKTEYKIIHGEKWRFQFRENGYVIVSDITTVKKGKKDVVIWRTGLHGTNLEACLQYVFSSFNGKAKFLQYDELESYNV